MLKSAYNLYCYGFKINIAIIPSLSAKQSLSNSQRLPLVFIPFAWFMFDVTFQKFKMRWLRGEDRQTCHCKDTAECRVLCSPLPRAAGKARLQNILLASKPTERERIADILWGVTQK